MNTTFTLQRRVDHITSRVRDDGILVRVVFCDESSVEYLITGKDLAIDPRVVVRDVPGKDP